MSGTVSLLINPHFNANDGAYHILFEVMQPADHGFQIVAGPGIIFADWNGNGYSLVVIPNSLPVGSWTNLVVTWTNGGSMTMYVDGKAIASSQAVGWLDTTGYRWSFGNRSTGGLDARSDLAQFGVWSRTLDFAEIASLADKRPPSTIPAGLLAEYDLVGSSLAAQAGTMGPLVASGTIPAPDLPPPPSPALSFNGASTATVGVPAYFSVFGSHLPNPTTLIFSDAGALGVFTPTRVTLTGASPAGAFSYTPPSSGAIAVSFTNDQSIENPPPISLQVTNVPISPTLSVDATSKSIMRGTDISFVITQNFPSGYTSDLPALRVYNLPVGFTFSVNGVDCGTNLAAIPYFNWSNCGTASTGTYNLTVHTASMAAGIYFFNVTESVKQLAHGAGVALKLTIN